MLQNLMKCTLEYLVILDKVNVEASKAVHVGDDLKADKDGANAIGIDCW